MNYSAKTEPPATLRFQNAFVTTDTPERIVTVSYFFMIIIMSGTAEAGTRDEQIITSCNAVFKDNPVTAC